MPEPSSPRVLFSPAKLLGMTLVLVATTLAGLVYYSYGTRPNAPKIGIDDLYRLAESNRIVNARLLDQDAEIVGTACSEEVVKILSPNETLARLTPPNCPGATSKFRASYRVGRINQALLDLVAKHAAITVDAQTPKALARVLATYICPLLLLANIFALILLSRTGTSGVDDIVAFGKLRGKRARQDSQAKVVTFADVAGSDEAVTELREVIDYLSDPLRFEAYGAAVPKGVLLFGSPGCGKTLIAKAVAGESKVPFVSVSGTDFVESLVGVGAARVRDLFAHVRSIAPAIVFIDEIDAVGRRRDGEGTSGGEREQTLNQLLVELDGFEASTGIVVMGATNRPDILDAALMRPGRFDRHVTLEPPDVSGRLEILKIHVRNKPLSRDIDLTTLAAATPGFTGADLANVINEAILLALRAGPGTVVTAAHIGEAIERVRHGPQRRGRLITPEERRRIAHHEAGHALVAAGVGLARNVARVSVVARGRGLGQSYVDDRAERVLLTVSELQASLAATMGGVAAEEIVFGEASTAVAHDVERATGLAREMVGRYGMSRRLGRRQVLAHGEDYLHDGGNIEHVSGHTLAEFDAEVARLITEAETRASDVLSRNLEHLEALAVRLEAAETLEGPALAALLAPVRPEGHPLPGKGNDKAPTRTRTRRVAPPT